MKEIEFEKDENVIYEVRKHWLVFATEVTILILLALLPLVVISLVGMTDFSFSSIMVGSVSLFFFAYALWLAVLWLFGVIFWTSYFLDVWVITSKKIIDVEQHGLFKRRVAFIHLDKIQDVTVKVSGLVPTILDYGDIAVQSAGMQGEFVIHGIPHPKFLHGKINEAVVIHREQNREKDREHNRSFA